MHYSDQEQLNENVLKLVIYIHTNLADPDDLLVQVASIQECKYFNPLTIQKILMVPEVFVNAHDCEHEQWLLFTFKDLGNDSIRIVSIENVSETDNEFHRLH